MQKKNKIKKQEVSENKISKSNDNQTEIELFFAKYIEPHTVKILIFLIAFIGFFAFRNYLNLNYLFFFKDIGSDSINISYPTTIHYFNLSSESFINRYSFFLGMGDLYLTYLPTEPFGIILTIISYLGISAFGSDYLIYGSFIYKFIHYFLFSGILFYYYLQTISIKKYSSLIGALLISFSGFLVVGSGWDFDSQIFIAVLLLFSFEQLYVKKRWYFFPIAVIYLSGNLFTFFIYSFFLLIYSLLRYFSENENKLKGYLQLIGKIITLGFVGLFMNFTNIGTVFLKMFFSPRVAGNASYSDVLTTKEVIIDNTNLGATTIFRFFSNDILGSGSNFQGWNNYLEAPLFYIGLLTLLIFPQIFIFLNNRKKIIFGSFFAFWILTLFVPYIRHAILLFTGDYFRFGFDFFIPFTLLFFAVNALNEIDKNFKINLPLLVGTFVILLIMLFFPYESIPDSMINGTLRKIVLFLMLIYGYLLFLFSKPQYKNIAQIGIVVLLVFELSYFSYTSYKDRVSITNKEYKLNSCGYNDGSIDAVNYIKTIDNTLFYRIEKDYQSGNAMHGSLNDAQAQGYYGTTSYSSFNQLNYIRFMEELEIIQKGDETATRWSRGFRDLPLLQTFANVKYHLSKSDKPYFQNLGFDSISKIDSVTILKNRYSLPFGYTYDKYIEFDDFKKLINYQITEQAIININTELSRSVGYQILNPILSKLQTLLNVNYTSSKDFLIAVQSLLGKEVSDEIFPIILKYSVLNFTNQVALLNGFVFEKDQFTNYDITEFSKIELSDTTLLLSANEFSFEKYKEFTDSLKQDTFRISEFSQNKIIGNIELTKEKMLFFTIPFDEGWKVKVDDKTEKLSRVNIGFTGIVIPKGKHKIELYFVTQYSKITGIISIISIAAFWLYIGFYIYKKRKNNLEQI